MKYFILLLFVSAICFSSTIIKDSGGTQVDVDNVVNALRVMSVEHAEIHAGDHYHSYAYNNDVDTSVAWAFKTSSKDVHFTFEYSSSKNGLVEFFEEPTVSTNNSTIGMFNSNRGSSNKCLAIFTVSKHAVGGDKRLYVESVGTDATSPQGKSGGLNKRSNELILKQNTSYLLKYTTQTNDNRVSIGILFYEE